MLLDQGEKQLKLVVQITLSSKRGAQRLKCSS